MDTAIIPSTIDDTLPYGIGDLNAKPQVEKGPPRRVQCYVKDCEQWLEVPTRQSRGEICPEHGVRCHHSSAGATYSYIDPRRNVIVDPDLFARRIVGHPFKYESHRLGAERSEDTLTWNVFRSLQKAGWLHHLAQLMTGERTRLEPFLYLWGICLTDDDLTPWSLLVTARQQFEDDLPVDRPLTEPDIALHLPGKYLILIEAKFTSPNTWYEHGPRRNATSLTLDELLTLYHDPTLRILDKRAARDATRVYHQLWRNTVFAEWMGRYDHPATKAYHVNLVREGADLDSAEQFRGLVHRNYQDRFTRLTWEAIYRATETVEALGRMRRYLKHKTAGLKPAFQID